MIMRALFGSAATATMLRGAVPLSAADAAFTPEDHYRLNSASDVQLSLDGSRLVFLEDSIDRQANRNFTRIWLMTIATGALAPLTPAGGSDTSPRWSPDGSSVALLSSDNGEPAVIVVTVRDGRRRTLVR